jgi:hypothetical protein
MMKLHRGRVAEVSGVVEQDYAGPHQVKKHRSGKRFRIQPCKGRGDRRVLADALEQRGRESASVHRNPAIA